MLRAVVLAVSLALAAVAVASSPRFYPDDPIWAENDKAFDASKVVPMEDTNGYDFLVNTVLNPGEQRDVRALNVNTLDDVPDSSWFTNRIGRREMSIAEIVRGPDQFERISLDGWVVSAGKGTGAQPGFRMTDPSGHLYQIEVDPPSNPELATAAEIIGTAFYHAFGYHTVAVYLATVDADALVISEKATIRDPMNGKRRAFTRRDLNDVFRKAARQPDGRYRVLVSRFADGKPLGNFRYYGTRPDDPNDIVAHEHRRELRGARVFGAWLNHDDSRGVNSLDMLETDNGKSWVKHYMFDFGSILGSGTVFAQRDRAGNEYLFEHRPGWLSLATLGFYIRPWMLIDYPDAPKAIGQLEGEAFEPETWKPEYPNPAFRNMRPDDAFWAARIVSRFGERQVRAIVQKAQYSDSRATDYLVRTLMMRREKVLRTWLNKVNPVVDPVLAADGTFTFANAAVDAAVATAAQSYSLHWFAYDNAADARTNAGEAVATTTLAARAPLAMLQGHEYIGVTITAAHPAQKEWSKPATFYFRRTATGWQWVGAERNVNAGL
jgi:hypothetical protein